MGISHSLTWSFASFFKHHIIKVAHAKNNNKRTVTTDENYAIARGSLVGSIGKEIQNKEFFVW